MKRFVLLPLLVLLCAVLLTPALAQEDSSDGELDEVEKALPEQAEEILVDVSAGDADAGQKGIDAIIEKIKDSGGILKKALKSAAEMLVVVVISSVVASTLEDGGVKDAVMLITVIALSVVAIDSAGSFISLGVDTLSSLSDFSKVILPTMCTAAASAGAFTSAAVKYAAASLFMDILITVSSRLIMPLITMYLTAVIAGAALGKDALTNIAKLLKWMCTTALTLLTAAFTLYLSVSGVISGTTDATAAKITKTAIGTLLPIVGGAVSSAAETVVAGAGLLRNSIGVFGMIAVAAVCITPFLTLGAHYLVYKGAAALTLALSDKRIADLIDGVSSAFGMVLALVGVGAVMIFLSLVSSMKAVTG